ncbi:MAG: LysE family transporter [Actinomycetota bacterium]
MSSLLSIAVALALIVIVPGPNVFAVTHTAMRDRAAGIRIALGVSTGDMIWASAALVGLGAALAHARPVFEVVKWCGVAYLVVFAISLWRADDVDVDERVDGDVRVTAGQSVGRGVFWRGLLIDLANPKAAIFFTTLFASMLPTDLSFGLAVAVLAVVAAIVYGWYLALALVLSRPEVQRGYRRAQRAINRLAAASVGALTVRLATA